MATEIRACACACLLYGPLGSRATFLSANSLISLRKSEYWIRLVFPGELVPNDPAIKPSRISADYQKLKFRTSGRVYMLWMHGGLARNSRQPRTLKKLSAARVEGSTYGTVGSLEGSTRLNHAPVDLRRVVQVLPILDAGGSHDDVLAPRERTPLWLGSHVFLHSKEQRLHLTSSCEMSSIT